MSNKKLKILLLAICCDGMRETLEEIGICYIASYLRENGFTVMLMQVREENVNYDKILDFKPDIIGMPVYEKSRNAISKTAEALKNILNETFIAVGGPFPTYCHTELLKEIPYVDCSIRGEGEITFLELAEKLEKGAGLEAIKGITYRQGNSIVINDERELIPDLNMLPWPARDLLIESNSKIAMISTSRGCLANCSFCSNQIFWKKWRGRDAKNVVDEIEFIMKKYGITIFNFADASFEDTDKENFRMRSIAEEIIRREIKIAYLADFRAEFHRKASDELIELLIESGLCGVCIGIEAADEEDLKIYRKIATVEDNFKVVEMFQKYNINILPGFITFNPYSSFKGLNKNIDFLEKYGFAASMEIVTNQYRMYKGGYLQKRIEKEGLMKSLDYKYDEYGYNFVDGRIELLINFIHEYIDTVHKSIPFAFETITNQLELFSCFVFQLKRKIKAEENEVVYMQFLNFEEKMKDMKGNLNATISAWFRAILDLAEAEWNEEKAWDISKKYLGLEYVNKMINRFIGNANRLQLNLLKINREYEKEFVVVK